MFAAWGAAATEANTQDSANAPAAPAGLEEIVVTATRREESISKVPISITAMSQDMLDQKGIRDITELVRFTPGVSIDSSGTNQISIRGISSSAGAGTTGIYIDDTPIQMRELGFNPDETLPKTFDLDRVEVLRGPQGTLFGSGSEGGTIRYIMTQPSVSQESTYVRSEASYTEWGQPNGEAGIAHGGPIIDGVLGYRASIWYRYDGGWINRVDNAGDVTERNANYQGTTAARFALLWQPNDNVKLTPSVMFQNKQQHDLSTFWRRLLRCGNRAFQQRDARAHSDSRRVLPACDQTAGRFCEPDVHLEQLVLSPQRDRFVPGNGLRPRLLSGARLAELAVSGCTAPRLRIRRRTESCAMEPNALLLVSAPGRYRYSHAAGIRELCDPEHDDQQPALLDAGVSPAVERPRLARQMDGRRLLAARAGALRRAAE